MVSWLALALGLAVAAPAHAEQSDSAHVRLRTSRGPIHVWTPAGYDPATADIVVYVHGYFVTADEAWRAHGLATQFERSGLAAKFIVCGAPSAHAEPIDWPSLDQLLAAIPDLPSGRVIVVAHSGGYRTVRSWLASSKLDAVVMLDAMYGPLPEVAPWLDAGPGRRLIDVSELTRPWADEVHAGLPTTMLLEELPTTWTDDARAAQVLHVHSQIGHHELVTGARVIPLVLGLFAR